MIKVYSMSDLYKLEMTTEDLLNKETDGTDKHNKLEYNSTILFKIEEFVTHNANSFNLNDNMGYNPTIHEFFDLDDLLYTEVYD